ncbi:Choline/ethanolamine kinase [Folsomia candida]|uniref:Choline/ethanolamine kinase n=1 Tax=Folsomia candida TaxID=158441 RepID=A0A226E6G8_FOLCA|nr:Choline/ethanolamine kinase [Folsomia candida]
MRSTRHKFKMLRGISSRSSTTNGGDGIGGACGGLPYRKQVHYQHSATFQRHSSADGTQSHKNNNQNHNRSDTKKFHRSNSDGQVNGSSAGNRSPRNRPYNQHPTPFKVSATIPLSSSFIKSGESNNNSNNFSERIQSLTWTEIHSSTTSTMDCKLNSDIRAKAFAICKDYLHGVWKAIDARDLAVKRISGGLSNYLYHCSLPPTLTPLYTEPIQVLLRFYGQVHGEGALESLITESVIFTLLSERKLGPRLYGIFPGGRVEEFIPARPLLTVELRDEELTLLIAQKMAQIHALNIPISKEPSWLWGTMDRWMANVEESLMKISLKDNPKSDIIQRLKEFNLPGELSWLKKYLPTVDSPVVFSHNGKIINLLTECKIGGSRPVATLERGGETLSRPCSPRGRTAGIRNRIHYIKSEFRSFL